MIESRVIRSKIMRAVKGKNTTPEIIVRKLLSRLGYRYRIHLSELPGKPDIVFTKKQKVIFVHGCFWHGHNCKRGRRKPVTNKQYWSIKIKNNKKRFKRQMAQLNCQGWQALIVWECFLNKKILKALEKRLVLFLGDPVTSFYEYQGAHQSSIMPHKLQS